MMGTSQKQNISTQHRLRNASAYVKSFEEWYPERVSNMRAKGFDIRSKEIRGTVIIGLLEGGKKPVFLTEVQFLEELRKQYEEEYLSQFGLNCKIEFEENVGIGQQ